MTEDTPLSQTREKLERARELRRREGTEPIGVMAHPGPAERRNEPIREESRDENLVRRRREDRTVNTFDIPVALQKPGWSYQWITVRVLNQPVDRSEIRDFTDNGAWRVVTAADMPSMADPGDPPSTPIEIRGQQLYTRPLRLTREAQQEDLEYAQEQQRDRTLAAANGRNAKGGDSDVGRGMGDVRGTRRVPLSIEIETLAGTG